MKAELFASDKLLKFKPYGDISMQAVADWNSLFYTHYRGQLLLMDFRELKTVSISVPEFTSVGLVDRARANPNPDLRVAYVTSSELIYGFARVIQNVWHDSVDVDVFRNLSDACAWLDVEEAEWQDLDLQVRGE